MLYGVLTPDSGRACIDGIDIRGETSRARAHLGVLPHAAGLYGNLTARENIDYFGSLHGMARERSSARTAELARRLGMEVSSTAASKASRRDSASRWRWRARWCTTPAISCWMNPPTDST